MAQKLQEQVLDLVENSRGELMTMITKLTNAKNSKQGLKLSTINKYYNELLKTYDPRDISIKGQAMDGNFVTVKGFNHTNEDLKHMDEDYYSSLPKQVKSRLQGVYYSVEITVNIIKKIKNKKTFKNTFFSIVMNKNVCYYYKTSNENNQTVYRCLYGGRYDVVEINSLDMKTYKNFRLNDKYTACDDDLIQFRDDFATYNNELRRPFFKNRDKTVFKVDIFNFNSMNDAIVNLVLMNSNQERINLIPDIKRREFILFENCLSCGLMTLDKDYIEVPFESYGYDYSKFYYNMMKRIRIPESEAIFYIMEELDYEKLDFGFYRVRVNCTNKDFMKIFNFNKTNHYNHNTLKQLYKFREQYDITFTLLPPDDEYNYNMVHYEKTVELKTLFSGWFKVMDTLLKECSKSNWLVKTLLSQPWGTLSKYKKHYVKKEDSSNYDWDHLKSISNSENYKYYAHEYENGIFTMIEAKKAFTYGDIARIKVFLTEFARGFVFNMLSSNNLAKDVCRIHTDGICMKRPVNFQSMKLDYYPIPEAKSTGTLKFYNLNCYYHICPDCGTEYKYDKTKLHECSC